MAKFDLHSNAQNPINMEASKRIEQLEWQIKSLADKQKFFNENISKLQQELALLKAELTQSQTKEEPQPLAETKTPVVPKKPEIPKVERVAQKPAMTRPVKAVKSNGEIERFIGRNLMVIIGILVLVLGLAFGVKYSIDHNLISEKGRIFLAYLTSVGLLGVAMKLKKKFETFSAVILSGACCSLYITTYVAFDSYGFIGREIAFVLMILFTIFTTLASLSYGKSIIAHLGLLGAYSIPFLLSQNSGNYPGLMLYISIINLGILFLSFKKDWKSLKIASFVATWGIYGLAIFDGFMREYWQWALFYSGLIFLTFFGIIFAYKFIKEKSLNALDVILILLNNILFYSYGMVILNYQDLGQYQGLFTVFVGALNFLPAFKIYKDRKRSDHLIHLLGTIVLTFLTIAIPVQLDGNWVTLFWLVEGIALLWLSRKNGVQFMQILGFVLVFISFFSFLDDINNARIAYDEVFRPVLNFKFLAGLIYCGLLAFSLKFCFKKEDKLFSGSLTFLKFCGIFLSFIVFMSFLILGINEVLISTGYYHRLNAVDIPDMGREYNWAIRKIGLISNFIYFALLTAFTFVISKRLKRFAELKYVHLILAALVLLFYLLGVLTTLERIGLYHFNPPNEFFDYGISLCLIRYAIIGIAVYFGMQIYGLARTFFHRQAMQAVTDIFLYGVLFATLAFELIFWMKVFEVPEPYKLGVSILAAVYTIYLIIRGIFARKAHLRYFGFVILAFVLLKLFFYDIEHLETLSKTIILVSIGLCMLVSSFLYNKYTKKLLEDE